MEAPPLDLSQDDQSVILDILDRNLNTTILHASLLGICLSTVLEVYTLASWRSLYGLHVCRLPILIGEGG